MHAADVRENVLFCKETTKLQQTNEQTTKKAALRAIQILFNRNAITQIIRDAHLYKHFKQQAIHSVVLKSKSKYRRLFICCFICFIRLIISFAVCFIAGNVIRAKITAE